MTHRSAGARILFVLVVGIVGSDAPARAQSAGTFTRTGNLITPRSLHSATLLPNGQVLVAGGASSNLPLTSAELYDPATGTFHATGAMTTARRVHTATLLPDGRVLIVGGYRTSEALASSELYDPVTGTFSPTGDLINARGGHSALLLPTGKVLIVGGYGTNTFPNVAPAELYDPATGTFSAAGAYVAHGGCDFCAPSVLLPDGTVLFPGQYPAQLYDPASDSFSSIGMMIADQNAAVVLMSGQALFAGGEGDFGRSGIAELYNARTHAFVATGNLSSGRGWHTLTLLPDGMALAAGGETDTCVAFGCYFAGSVATAELYDPQAGAFVPTGSMTAARETHTATLLADGRVLVAGGVWYGGIGIFGGALDSAELYTPRVLVAAPALMSLSGTGHGQGAIFHAGTSYVAGSADPAAAGDKVDIYCTGLTSDSAIPPQVSIGDRLATVLAISNAPGLAGVMQLTVRVPGGVARGPAVPVRLSYIGRPTNEVTLGVQ